MKNEILKNIVFFDGYCVLCNGLVDFLIKIDTKDKLKYSSLQGKTAVQNLDKKYYFQPNTLVFFGSSEKIFEKSDAVLKIAKTIGGPWSILKIFEIVPKKFRDGLYDIIAKHRYGTFGKRTHCRLPTKDEIDKILP